MAKLRREMGRRMLDNGYYVCPVELDRPSESIWEFCTHLVNTVEFRPTLQAQGDDAATNGQVGRVKVFGGPLVPSGRQSRLTRRWGRVRSVRRRNLLEAHGEIDGFRSRYRAAGEMNVKHGRADNNMGLAAFRTGQGLKGLLRYETKLGLKIPSGVTTMPGHDQRRF